MEDNPAAAIEVGGGRDDGPDAGDVAEEEPAHIEVEVTGGKERRPKRIPHRLDVPGVDLPADPKPIRLGAARDP